MTITNKTKIVATVGPASNTKEKLLELIVSGVDVFRLNFSHGTHEEHKKVITFIKEINETFNFNIGILQDLQGPKIRLREIAGGSIEVVKGQKIVIAYEKGEGTQERLTSTYNLAKDVKVGEQVLVDDGNLEFRVLEILSPREVLLEVVYGGIVKPKKGINLPESNVTTPSLTKKDREDLEFGLANDVDWIALSFVRTAIDVLELKNIIAESGKHAKVISKIETPMAVKNIDEIINVTDGLMVARGDLGVEIPLEQVPLVQKTLVKKCNQAAKPVIIATQMMESMITNPRPTRAETNDIANAVLDGADAVMLSAETASGKYPVKVVQTMTRIISVIEKNYLDIYHKYYEIQIDSSKNVKKERDFKSQAMVAHGCRLGKEVNAKAIICMTKSGYTAFQIATHRPEANIFVFTRSKILLSMLNLVWGVRGFYYEKVSSMSETFEDLERLLVEAGHLQKGDIYVSTRSQKLSNGKGGTNILKMDMVD
ncbi:MAG: pyruvate kinase [Bacteroidetes bacterium]|nr:MAG: pyruvate kinase [Bacteroidota bacterium]